MAFQLQKTGVVGLIDIRQYRNFCVSIARKAASEQMDIIRTELPNSVLPQGMVFPDSRTEIKAKTNTIN